MKTQLQHRRDIVEVLRRIYARGWISSSDGNVSIRLDRDRILTTPTGKHKGFINERELVICDMQGRRISGQHEPSSEIAMHIASYQERPDVQAVVHAHPTYCIAFSVAGVTLAQCLLPEIVFTFGGIPTAEYSAPTTDEVPRAIRSLLRDYDAMILDRHGSLTVGGDIFDAYDKLERMEHVAQITHAARQLGEVRPLSREQVEQLIYIGDGLGLPRRKVELPCEQCNACAHGQLPQRSPGAPTRPRTWQTWTHGQSAETAAATSKPVHFANARPTDMSPVIVDPPHVGCGPVAVEVEAGLDARSLAIIAEEVARELGGSK